MICIESCSQKAAISSAQQTKNKSVVTNRSDTFYPLDTIVHIDTVIYGNGFGLPSERSWHWKVMNSYDILRVMVVIVNLSDSEKVFYPFCNAGDFSPNPTSIKVEKGQQGKFIALFRPNGKKGNLMREIILKNSDSLIILHYYGLLN
jgi:hypothetical protein